jgi:hypothetical protein
MQELEKGTAILSWALYLTMDLNTQALVDCNLKIMCAAITKELVNTRELLILMFMSWTVFLPPHNFVPSIINLGA